MPASASKCTQIGPVIFAGNVLQIAIGWQMYNFWFWSANETVQSITCQPMPSNSSGFPSSLALTSAGNFLWRKSSQMSRRFSQKKPEAHYGYLDWAVGDTSFGL